MQHFLSTRSFTIYNLKTKEVVCGLGEIGKPVYEIFSSSFPTQGFDIDPKLIPKNNSKFDKYETKFLHICIPFNSRFIRNIQELKKKFSPQGIVIHSTISPGTTKKIQDKIKDIPIIYSATRGVHKRMLSDLKKYVKFFSLEKDAPRVKWASSQYVSIMKKCVVKTKQMTNPITLELAKIVVDTSYYGWLINYAQISNIIAQKHNVDYDEMWSFADEIQKFLGNRPKMFPGFIGGHCVIPNLELIDDSALWQIDKINNIYTKKVKNAKSIAKKYVKGK